MIKDIKDTITETVIHTISTATTKKSSVVLVAKSQNTAKKIIISKVSL